MKSYLTCIFFCLLTAWVYPQGMFNKLFSPEAAFYTSDKTQKGNSVSDIIVQGDTIIIGSSGGLSISVDGGLNWNNFYSNENFEDENISAIAYKNGILWIALHHTEELNGNDIDTGGGLAYSFDLGENWTFVEQPVDDPADSLIIYGINDGISNPKMRALPVTVPQQNVTWDIEIINQTVWITSWAGGLRKSSDFGVTWERVILPPDNLNFITPDSVYSFALQVQAGSFGSEAHLNHVCFAITGANDTAIYVGTANGINKSTDGGLSWINFNHDNQDFPISGNFVTALKYDSLNNTVWASTWKTEGSTQFYGISSSSNGGIRWQTFLPGEKAHNFGFFHKTKNNTIHSEPLVATDNGVFRTSDGGITWVSPPSIYDPVTGLSVAEPKAYTVAAEGNTIWIGTSRNGLAKLTEGNRAWDGRWDIALASDVINEEESFAFPNPFSPTFGNVKIKYRLGNNSANVTIRIFDFSMTLVRTVIQNIWKDSGMDHFELWDGRDDQGSFVPNGVYFCRIDMNDKVIFNKIAVLR